MTKLRQSLRNLVKCGPLLKISLSLVIFSGCSSSTTPTYLKEDIAKAVSDISKNEYKIDLKARLTGQTLWVYLALSDIITKDDNPKKYVERFIVTNKTEFNQQDLKTEYLVMPVVPEKEKLQEVKYAKSASEKIDSLWRVLRRVIFSMEEVKHGSPQFFCVVIADIKNGFRIKDIFYYQDLKKVSYYFIPVTEFHHRTIQENEISPAIIGDQEGSSLDYKDITLKEFIAWQIQHRIRLKFEKPEVEAGADIDKEILKIITNTLKIYEYKDFSSVELNNLLTQNRMILNHKAILERFMD